MYFLYHRHLFSLADDAKGTLKSQRTDHLDHRYVHQKVCILLALHLKRGLAQSLVVPAFAVSVSFHPPPPLLG